MKRKKKDSKRGLIAFIVLCLIVLVSGFALWQDNDLQNPFRSLSMFLPMGANMEGRLEHDGPPDGGFDMRGQRPPDGGNFDRPEGRDGGGSMNFWNIQWQDIGSVFYNIWLMLAATVAVIVIARPIGWLMKRFKAYIGYRQEVF